MSDDVSSGDPRNEQRDALLRAALGILHEQGASGLTVRNVATRAGCSTTGVYTYFGGKNGLVEAIFVEGFEGFDAVMAVAEREGRVLDAGLAYRGWALANPTHYLVMFGSAVPDFEPSDAALVRAMESFDHLVAMVEAAAPGPLSAERATELAFHTWATVHGYVMLELVGLLGPPADAERFYRAGLDRLAVHLTSQPA